MRVPVLEGPRVRLRPLCEGDIDDLFAILSDPEVMRYWSCPPLTERSQAEEHYRKNVGEDALCWGVTRGGSLIGTVSLYALERQCERAEIGYLLGREHWGKGLASEAVSLVIDLAFGPLNLRRLEADIDPRNTASARLLERLGFENEGFLRERWKVGGEISDTALYGLLKRDWEARTFGERRRCS
jgi:RimJ/RimL family protein N-acetyltransferase